MCGGGSGGCGENVIMVQDAAVVGSYPNMNKCVDAVVLCGVVERSLDLGGGWCGVFGGGLVVVERSRSTFFAKVVEKFLGYLNEI